MVKCIGFSYVLLVVSHNLASTPVYGYLCVWYVWVWRVREHVPVPVVPL